MKQHIHYVLAVIILLAGAGVFWFRVTSEAATCQGWVYRQGVWESTVFDCAWDCENLNPEPASCSDIYDPTVPAQNPTECVGADTFGPSGAVPDGTGDMVHRCDDHTVGGNNPTGDCINILIEGNPPGASCIGNSEMSGCTWVRGSYVVEHGYCGRTNNPPINYPFTILNNFPTSICSNDPNTNMILYQGKELPGIDENYATPVKGAFCPDACSEWQDRTVDYQTCSEPGGSEYIDDWQYTSCPYTVYDNTCTGTDTSGDGVGDTVRQRLCDDLAPTPFNFSSSEYDGRDISGNYTTENCANYSQNAACFEECGTQDNPQADLCTGAAVGYCDNTGGSAFCTGVANAELDVSQTRVNDFYVDCGVGNMEDNVKWAQGALPQDHGEYDNQVAIEIYNDQGDPDNIIMTRSNFQTEACGDDIDEINVGSYCCNIDKSHHISAVTDNVPGDQYCYPDGTCLPIDMSGNYCVNATGCGDFDLDAGEQCDALYGLLAYSYGDVWIPRYKYLGVDSNCVGIGNYCKSDCTCNLSVPCDAGNFNDAGKKYEVKQNGVELLKMDSNGMVLLKGVVIEGNIGSYPEPAYVIRNDAEILMVVDRDGNLHLSGSLNEDLTNTDLANIANKQLVIDSGPSSHLGVVDTDGDFNIKSCLAEGAL